MKFSFFLLVILVPAFASAQTSEQTLGSIRKSLPAVKQADTLDEFIEVSEEPKPLQNIQSLVVYPRKAKKARIEGKVIFSALIGIDGKAEKVHIDNSNNKIFNQAVIDAVKNTKFKPAIGSLNKPVRVWYTQTISFKLKPAGDEQDYH